MPFVYYALAVPTGLSQYHLPVYYTIGMQMAFANIWRRSPRVSILSSASDVNEKGILILDCRVAVIIDSLDFLETAFALRDAFLPLK